MAKGSTGCRDGGQIGTAHTDSSDGEELSPQWC